MRRRSRGCLFPWGLGVTHHPLDSSLLNGVGGYPGLQSRVTKSPSDPAEELCWPSLLSPRTIGVVIGPVPPRPGEESVAMPVCPHCGREIEAPLTLEGEPRPARRVPWYRRELWGERGLPRVSLG